MALRISLNRRTAFHLSVSLLVTGLLLLFVFNELSYPQFIEILFNVHLGFFGAYVCCSMLGWVLRAWRTSLLLQGLSDPFPQLTFKRLLLVVGVRNALVDFLPARLGEVSFVYFLSRLGVTTLTGFASLGLGMVLDVLGLCIMCGAVFLLWEPSMLPVVLTIILGVLCYYFVLSLAEITSCFARSLKHCAAILKRPLFKRAAATVGDWLAELEQEFLTFRRRGMLPKLLLLSLALRVTKYGGLLLLLLAVVGQWGITLKDLHPVGVVGAFVGAEAAASLPASGVMGFGAYEGAWSLVFKNACQGSGCSEIPIVPVSFAVHLLSQLVGYSLGFSCALTLCLIIGGNKNTRP